MIALARLWLAFGLLSVSGACTRLARRLMAE
jgi:hypothetical protein